MKIAYIAVRGLAMSGGIEKYTEELANHLSDRGHDITVYCTRHYGNHDGMYGKFRVKTVPALKFKFFEKMSLSFMASIYQIPIKYDVIHYHALGPSFFALIPKLQQKKIVIQSHGIEYKRAKWGRIAKLVLRILEKLSYNMGNELTVVSRQIQEYFRRTYYKESIYIPTAVNFPDEKKVDSQILNKYELWPNEFYLFLARIVEEKGAHYLIEAFRKSNSTRKLVIAGKIEVNNFYHKKLLEMAVDDKRIIFVGEVLGEDKAALFKNAYSFCMPSELEGMSIALLEAMSYKRCCIVSDIPENLDIALGHALFFKSKNVNDLIKVINKTDKLDLMIIQKYGADAYDYVKDNHTFDIIAKQMEHLYQSI